MLLLVIAYVVSSRSSHQNLHQFGYFQANPATFWQGQRVKVVPLKVLVLVVYLVAGDLDFFGRQETPKATSHKWLCVSP